LKSEDEIIKTFIGLVPMNVFFFIAKPYEAMIFKSKGTA
jgi:hypothetical protein